MVKYSDYLVSVVGDAPRTTDFDSWIGATAVNPVTGPWSWVDGQPVSFLVYSFKIDCAF